MIMADVIKIFLLVIGGLVIINCYWLLAESLFAGMVERARISGAHRPVRNTLLGLAVGGPSILLGLSLIENFSGVPPVALIGWIAVLGPAAIGLMGSTGLVKRIGMGLPSPRDEAQPWLPVLRGGIVLSLCCLLPFLGWFVVAPLALMNGFGNGLLALTGRHTTTTSMPAEATPAAA